MDVQGRARIEARTEAVGQPGLGDRLRRGERLMAAEEALPVAGRGEGRFAGGEKRDVSGECFGVRIAREHGAQIRRVLGDNVQRLSFTRRAQPPLGVRKHAQRDRLSAEVGQEQTRELHRVDRIDEHGKLLLDVVNRAREPGHAKSVLRHDRRVA